MLNYSWRFPKNPELRLLSNKDNTNKFTEIKFTGSPNSEISNDIEHLNPLKIQAMLF